MTLAPRECTVSIAHVSNNERACTNREAEISSKSKLADYKFVRLSYVRIDRHKTYIFIKSCEPGVSMRDAQE